MHLSLFLSKHSLVDGLLFLHFFVMVTAAATAAADNEQQQEQNASAASKLLLIVLVVFACAGSITMSLITVVVTGQARVCAPRFLFDLSGRVVIIPISCISAAGSTFANVCAVLNVEAAMSRGVARTICLASTQSRGCCI